MLPRALYIVAILSATLFSVSAVAEMTTKTFRDWKVTTGYDNPRVMFHATGDLIHPDGSHIPDGYYISCLMPSSGDGSWALKLHDFLTLPEPVLTYTFDDTRKVVVDYSNGYVAESDVLKVLAAMMISRTMSYPHKDRNIRVSMMGVTAVLRNYLDMCPATNVPGIKARLGL